ISFINVPMFVVVLVNAPLDLMSTGQSKAVLDVEVDRVELVEKARIVAARAIVVDARAPSGLFIDRPAPACEDMAASQVARELSGRSRAADHGDRRRDLTDSTVVGRTLNHE